MIDAIIPCVISEIRRGLRLRTEGLMVRNLPACHRRDLSLGSNGVSVAEGSKFSFYEVLPATTTFSPTIISFYLQHKGL